MALYDRSASGITPPVHISINALNRFTHTHVEFIKNRPQSFVYLHEQQFTILIIIVSFMQVKSRYMALCFSLLIFKPVLSWL